MTAAQRERAAYPRGGARGYGLHIPHAHSPLPLPAAGRMGPAAGVGRPARPCGVRGAALRPPRSRGVAELAPGRWLSARGAPGRGNDGARIGHLRVRTSGEEGPHGPVEDVWSLEVEPECRSPASPFPPDSPPATRTEACLEPGILNVADAAAAPPVNLAQGPRLDHRSGPPAPYAAFRAAPPRAACRGQRLCERESARRIAGFLELNARDRALPLLLPLLLPLTA